MTRLGLIGLLLAACATAGQGELALARQRLELDASGLPAQIQIVPDSYEIPWPMRAAKEAPALTSHGRGPQLRSPLRLEVSTDGAPVVLAPLAPAEPQAVGSEFTVTTVLKGGGCTLNLSAAIQRDGEMSYTLQFAASSALQGLDLVLEPEGDIDAAFVGSPLNTQTVPDGHGLVWRDQDSGAAVKAGNPSPIFVGSGDRGYNVTGGSDSGWLTDPARPLVTVERDDAGRPTVRVRLINLPTTVSDQQISFGFWVSPRRSRAADFRGKQWQAITGATGEMTVLAGAFGGAAQSAAGTLADAFPMTVFRVLAGTHTTVPAQLQTNARELVRPGGRRDCDRMAIGRALLHGIGLDVTTLAHGTEAANLLRLLGAFGYEQADVELIPYWRSDKLLQFGEAFTGQDAFATSAEDPLARVHLSLYRRPTAQSGRWQVMMVIVNEGPAPVREQLRIVDSVALFGGLNTIEAAKVIDGWDFSGIPAESDWRAEESRKRGMDRNKPLSALRDLEDGGYVRSQHRGRDGETYGLLHIPARSFRILYGTGEK